MGGSAEEGGEIPLLGAGLRPRRSGAGLGCVGCSGNTGALFVAGEPGRTETACVMYVRRQIPTASPKSVVPTQNNSTFLQLLALLIGLG